MNERSEFIPGERPPGSRTAMGSGGAQLPGGTMNERSEFIPGERPPGSRTAMGPGGEQPPGER